MLNASDCNEADENDYKVAAGVKSTEVDECRRLLLVQLVNVAVKAHIVHQNDDECVQSADRVVRLLLLDVTPVRVHQIDALEELNVVNEAYKLILAVTEKASKVDNAEDRVYELDGERDDTHRHQSDARREVLLLQVLELLNVLGLFLDEAGLLLGASFTKLLLYILHVLLVHQVRFMEHILNGLGCRVSVFLAGIYFLTFIVVVILGTTIISTLAAATATSSVTATTLHDHGQGSLAI